MTADRHHHGYYGGTGGQSERVPGIFMKLELGVSLTPQSRRELSINYASKSDAPLSGRLVPACLVPAHRRPDRERVPASGTQDNHVRMRRIRTRSALQLGRTPLQPQIEYGNVQPPLISGPSHHVTEYYAPPAYTRRVYPHPERGLVHTIPLQNEEIPVREYFSPQGVIDVPRMDPGTMHPERPALPTTTPSPRTYAALGFHPMSPETVPGTPPSEGFPWSPDSIARTSPSIQSRSSYYGAISPQSTSSYSHYGTLPLLRRESTIDRKPLPPLPSGYGPSSYRLGGDDLPWSSPTWIDPDEPVYSEPLPATIPAENSVRREDPQRTRYLQSFQEAMMSIDSLDDDLWEGAHDWDSVGELAHLPRGPRGVGWAVRVEPADEQGGERTNTSSRTSFSPMSPPPPYSNERFRYLTAGDQWVWDDAVGGYYARPDMRRRGSTGGQNLHGAG